MNLISTFRRGFALFLFLGCVMPALGQTPGAEDTAFAIEPLAPSRPSVGFGVQPDGKILVAMDSGGGFGVRRYLPNGQIDTSFGSGGTASVEVFGRGGVSTSLLLVDPLGRIYVQGGYFFQYSSPDSVRDERGSAIARFLSSGAVDTSFGNGGVVRHDYFHEWNPSSPSSPPVTRVTGIPGLHFVWEFTLLPDGKLLVLGGLMNSGNSLVVARLNVNGQLDSSFGGTGVRTLDLGEALTVTAMKSAPDGAVVVLGRNATTTEEVVLKLSAQGTLATSFGNGGKVRISDNAAYDYSVADLEVQPDGMILLGGARVPASATQPNGNPGESILARLTTSGALDSSFGNGGLSALSLPDRNGIQQLALELNGKILAAGSTTAIATNGTATSRLFLVRTHPNGQIDTGFQQQLLDNDALAVDLAVSHAAYLLFFPTSSGSPQLRKFFIDPAPRTGSLSTGQTPSVTGFNVDVLNAGGLAVDSAPMSHVLGLHGYIYTQPADLGANADVFVVASTARGLYMRTTSGAFVAWSGRVSDLQPAYENVQLAARTYVPIYGGALPFAGPYAIYLGYMRDSGPLVYIEEPIGFQITQ